MAESHLWQGGRVTPVTGVAESYLWQGGIVTPMAGWQNHTCGRSHTCGRGGRITPMAGWQCHTAGLMISSHQDLKIYSSRKLKTQPRPEMEGQSPFTACHRQPRPTRPLQRFHRQSTDPATACQCDKHAGLVLLLTSGQNVVFMSISRKLAKWMHVYVWMP